jgi:hypothetical protein
MSSTEELQYIKERISEVVKNILNEKAPLEAWEFRWEFKRRTGWEYWFGDIKGVTKELVHGQWEARVDSAEDTVIMSEDRCYAVRATTMWLIDTYNEHFWIVDMDIEGVSALPEGECRVKSAEDEWKDWDEEGWEEYEYEDEWEEEIWEEEGI